MADIPYVVVVGGANMDIAGRSTGPLVGRDSNPGTVRASHGGVGRNVAHNLALLGVDVRLVTAFGDDAWARELIEGCRAAGVDVEGSLVIPGADTSTYLYVADEAGEMAVAVSDMAVLGELTRGRLARRLGLLRGASLVVADANLSAETLGWLADSVDAPIFCDPISSAKAGRLSGVLGRLDTLKPNRLEAEALTGIRISDRGSLRRAARTLLGTGLRRIFLSLGSDGLLCAERGRETLLPARGGRPVSTTGAGDAALAALAWAHLRGMGLEEAGHAALAASSIAIESDRTVSPHMCEGELLARMERPDRRAGAKPIPASPPPVSQRPSGRA